MIDSFDAIKSFEDRLKIQTLLHSYFITCLAYLNGTTTSFRSLVLNRTNARLNHSYCNICSDKSKLKAWRRKVRKYKNRLREYARDVVWKQYDYLPHSYSLIALCFLVVTLCVHSIVMQALCST